MAPISELDGAGAVTMRFVFGSKANVPDFIKVYATNKLYRVFSDELGTPRGIYDVAASAMYKPRFDEFGIKLGDTTPFEIPFGFAGGLYDADTKLTRFGARDYDASIGRWVSKDPILFKGGQANLYVYVGNDPVNLTDPRGLAPTDKLWGLPSRFWRWYHRNFKKRGDPDLERDEARQLCNDWEQMGKPGPDNKRPRGLVDDIDSFLPGPIFPNFCSIFPHMLHCGEEA